VKIRMARDQLRSRLSRRGVALSVVGVEGALVDQLAGAAVPAAQGQATVRAALAGAAAGVIRVEVLSMTEGALRAMFLNRVKNAALILLSLSLLGLGAGFAGQAWSTGPDASASQPRSDDRVPLAKAPAPPAAPAGDPGEALLEVTTNEDRALPDDTPLPAGAVARLGSIHFVQDNSVASVALSPDGKFAAAHDGYRMINLWETATGKRKWQVSSEGDHGAAPLQFSPDGRLLVGGNKVAVWEVESGKRLYALLSGGPLAFSPDGTFLAFGRGGNVVIWEFDTAKRSRTIDGVAPVNGFERKPGSEIRALAFTSDGKRMVAGTDLAVSLWDIDTGGKVADWKAPPISVAAAVVSADGKHLAVGDMARTVHLLETDTGKALRQFKVPEREQAKIRGDDRGNEVFRLAFSADDKALTAVCADGSAARWETATGKESQHFTPMRFSMNGPAHLALSADGTLLAGAYGRTLRFWDTTTGRERYASGHRGQVSDLAFSAGGRTLVSVGGDRTVRQWEVASGRAQRCWQPRQDHQDDICRLSADGQLAVSVSQWDRMLRAWDVASGQARPVQARIDHRRPVWDGSVPAVFGPAGHALAYFAVPPDPDRQPREYRVCVWDGTAGQKLESVVSTHFGAFALLPDGKTLAQGATNADKRELLCLCDAQTGKKIRTIVGPAPNAPAQNIYAKRGVDQVLALSASPDGRTLAGLVLNTLTSGSEGPPGAPRLPPITSTTVTLRLWDVSTGKEQSLISKPYSHGMLYGGAKDDNLIRYYQDYNPSSLSASVRFSPDGRTLAFGCENGAVVLWETATGKERIRFSGHRGGIRCLGFAPDGELLASGGVDGIILLWDLLGRAPAAVPSDKELQTLWDDLKLDDAARAFRALRTLVRAPQQALPWLNERVQPVRDETQRIQQLLADLEGNQFAARQQAAAELEKLGDVAEPALRRLLAAKPALEVSQRIEQILKKGEGRHMTPERLRLLRAIEVLERIGTEPAREVLRRQAQGGADDRLTQEARAALGRLEKGR